MKAINLRDHEVRHLLEHGQVVVVGAVELNIYESDVNPPRFTDVTAGDIFICPDFFPTDGKRGWVFAEAKGPGSYHCMGRKTFAEKHCPFGTPGTEAWGRETFKIDEDDQPVIFYRATDAGAEDCDLPWRSSVTMPRWASRFEDLRVVSVDVKQVQNISEADAIGAGMDMATCEAVFNRAAGNAKIESAYYPESEDGDSSNYGWYCQACAETISERDGMEVRAGFAPQSDGPAYCDECRVALYMSLTVDGIESELRLTEQEPQSPYFPVSGTDARIIEQIAGGMGDLHEHQMGRLAQIGFATLWDSLNAKRGYGWDANPWVWLGVIENKKHGKGVQ